MNLKSKHFKFINSNSNSNSSFQTQLKSSFLDYSFSWVRRKLNYVARLSLPPTQGSVVIFLPCPPLFWVHEVGFGYLLV